LPDELFNQHWNDHRVIRTNLGQGSNRCILKSPITGRIHQVRNSRLGVRAKAAERPHRLPTSLANVVLVSQDGDPAFDSLAIARKLLIGAARLRPTDQNQKGRKNGSHDYVPRSEARSRAQEHSPETADLIRPRIR
jgi:hypothetical protein